MKPTGDSLRTPEVKAKNDALARKLGLWKDGIPTQCFPQPSPHAINDLWCVERGWMLEKDHAPHTIPPPDLTTAEGHLLLEKTLRKYRNSHNAHYNIDIRPDFVIVYEIDTAGMNVAHSDDPDPAIALILAAYKLLVET